MRNRHCAYFLLAFVAAVTPAFAVDAVANWPQFRGPDARGVADNAGLPEQWSATENIAWKTGIPGRGWSSPIVWGNRVFVTTAVALGDAAAPKKGLYFGGEQKEVAPTAWQWKVFCLDLASGAVLWERQVHEGIPAHPIHIKNSYASETPVTDGERVYAYFGNIGIWCFDMDGNPVWNKEIAPHRTRVEWGTASSPVLHEERLYIVNDNEEESYLLALDKRTGNEVWKVARDEKSNWSTPCVWVNAQRTEIVTPGTGLSRAYDLEGKELWSFDGMSAITIATPYAANGLLYLSSGYVGDKRRPIVAIRPGASGDLTLAEGQTSNAGIAWSRPKDGPYNPSTLVYGERLYVLYDSGMVSCFNALDGATVYEKQRIPEAKAFTASPWASNGKIYCLNEDGITYVLKAGDSFEFIRQNPLDSDEMALATPAMAGDRLLIRTAGSLYCIRNAQ